MPEGDANADSERMQVLLRRFEIPSLQFATRISGDRERARDVVQETAVDPLKYSVPPENARPNSNEMLTVKLRYKRPEGDKSELIEDAVVDDRRQFANTSADFKFAGAVAEFGMLLRDSEFKGNGTLGAVLEWAQEGKGADRNGYRAAFLELVRKADAL